jgi:hypothetical protein
MTSLPALLLVAATPMADRPGFKSPALFTRMPSFHLSDQGAVKETQFDCFEFSVTSAGKTAK